MSDAFLAPIFDNIPQELRMLPRWVMWKAEGNAGEKPRKVPYTPGRPNTHASSIDPATWGTFEQSAASFQSGGFTGIGFVLDGTGPVGVTSIAACRRTPRMCPLGSIMFARASPMVVALRVTWRCHNCPMDPKFKSDRNMFPTPPMG